MYVFVVIAVVVLFYLICVRPLNYWQRHGVAQYKWYVTIFETLLSLKPYRTILDAIEKLNKDFVEERYCGIYQFFRPVLVIKDPELIKQITVKDFEYFTDHNQVLSEDSDPIWGKNLFALKGDKWRTMRATLSPSFTSSKMKIIFKLISEYMVKAVEYFEEQPQPITLEMKDTSSRITNDVIATTAFGIQCDSLRNPENDFFLTGKSMTSFTGFKQHLRLFCVILIPPLAKLLGLRFFNSKSIEFFSNIVRSNIQSREKHNIVRTDMIHLLMETRNSENVKLTDDDIIAQAFIFFFAGFDSVSTIMSFIAHELAVNADVQERLQHEIDETLANCSAGLTYEELFKMKYMEMVVLETLRKWPAAVISDRSCVKPYTIEPVQDGEKPLHLKKGDVLNILTMGVQRDERFFPDPERFDPERFNDDNKANIAPYSYIPFGVGPRICIGNRFALMEIKTLFFYLLSKFTLTVVDKTNVPFRVGKTSFQLTSEGGFWLGLERRNL